MMSLGILKSVSLNTVVKLMYSCNKIGGGDNSAVVELVLSFSKYTKDKMESSLRSGTYKGHHWVNF